MAENTKRTTEPRALRLRYPDTCTTCGSDVPRGARAWWSSKDKTVECDACHDTTEAVAPERNTPPAPTASGAEATASGPHQPSRSRANHEDSSSPRAGHGTGTGAVTIGAGASAQREYERRAARERARQEATIARDEAQRNARRAARPVLGRLVNVLAERPPNPRETRPTQAWKIGAAGERRVAEILDATACFVLHDRRVPGSRANIDHVAVGAAGVFVIDAKKYDDAQLQVRDNGTLFSRDLRLYVGGRDRTKLLTGIKAQVEVVRYVLDRDDVVVHPVLCFVGAQWPGLFSNKEIHISGVTATWPVALGNHVTRDGTLTDEQITTIGEVLAARLRPA